MPPNLNEKFINLSKIVLLANGTDTSNVVMLARMYLKGQGTPVNPKAAFHLLSALEPEKHDPEGESLFLLAYLHEEGLGTPPDMTKAFELYLESSNRGYPQAWNNLGTLYETGTGTQKDIYRARECYQEAADRKDTEGKANLERLKAIRE